MTSFIELAYFIASLLFILGLCGLRSPETARRGIVLAGSGEDAGPYECSVGRSQRAL